MNNINTYTRQEAIEDGSLIDVSLWARKVGYRYPVAMTRNAWRRFIEAPDDVEPPRDLETRIHDVLNMGVCQSVNALSIAKMRDRIQVYNARNRALSTLKVDCRKGDDDETVITIMLPNED